MWNNHSAHTFQRSTWGLSSTTIAPNSLSLHEHLILYLMLYLISSSSSLSQPIVAEVELQLIISNIINNTPETAPFYLECHIVLWFQNFWNSCFVLSSLAFELQLLCTSNLLLNVQVSLFPAKRLIFDKEALTVFQAEKWKKYQLRSCASCLIIAEQV